MQTEESKIRDAFQHVDDARTAGKRFVYSKDLRRIVEVDDKDVAAGKDPDKFLSVTPEDMDVFADSDERVPLIVLSGEQIHAVASTACVAPASFCRWKTASTASSIR